MGMLAWIFGSLGGLSMVMGLITATKAIPKFGEELTWLFWFILSGLLLLISIAFAAGRSYEE